MTVIPLIKAEHIEIKGILLGIESFMQNDSLDQHILINKFESLYKLWDEHEAREEGYFGKFNYENRSFPTSKMLIEQHRELRGHWKVLRDAIASCDEQEIEIALDTDGRMLIDKIRKHIEIEDTFLDKLESQMDAK